VEKPISPGMSSSNWLPLAGRILHAGSKILTQNPGSWIQEPADKFGISGEYFERLGGFC
jgi:hypothetical protein